jgi:hypothetical protein
MSDRIAEIEKRLIERDEVDEKSDYPKWNEYSNHAPEDIRYLLDEVKWLESQLLGSKVERHRLSKIICSQPHTENCLLTEERDQLKTRVEKLEAEMRHAMAYYKSCGDEADPEFQLYRSFEKVLAESNSPRGHGK